MNPISDLYFYLLLFLLLFLGVELIMRITCQWKHLLEGIIILVPNIFRVIEVSNLSSMYSELLVFIVLFVMLLI